MVAEWKMDYIFQNIDFLVSLMSFFEFPIHFFPPGLPGKNHIVLTSAL